LETRIAGGLHHGELSIRPALDAGNELVEVARHLPVDPPLDVPLEQKRKAKRGKHESRNDEGGRTGQQAQAQ
jgi:hypothetical protein